MVWITSSPLGLSDTKPIQPVIPSEVEVKHADEQMSWFCHGILRLRSASLRMTRHKISMQSP